MPDHDGLDRPPLLVFNDDWGRHPSSCQHLVGQLRNRHAVMWVNTIGTRLPRLDLATLNRGWEKLGQWAARFRSPPTDCGQPSNDRQFDVVSPVMWPSFRSRLERRLNRELVVRQLKPRIAPLPEPPIAITTIPLLADLIGQLPVRRWVYYCVDDFAEWPGLDGGTMRLMEQALIKRADVIVAVSEVLQQKIAAQGRGAHLLTHGVDLDHWAGSDRPIAARLSCLPGDLERPLIVFWGVIDRRMDTSFLAHLTRDLTEGTVLLVGPEAEADPNLDRLARVVRRPAVPYEQLPEIAALADVLIMPYADLPVTRAMQPLKLKEYLATGKPVVVRDLPSTRVWSDALDLAGSDEDFSRLVRQRIASGLPDSQSRARGRLAEESWCAKARVFEQLLIGDNPPSPDPDGLIKERSRNLHHAVV
jgi:glycosyltransferase involved in cell wall biosynthesis